MSEQAPEPTTQAPARTSGSKLGVWGRKVGPLPMWAWVAILLGGVLAFMFWKNKSSGASTASSDPGSSAAAGTTDASQIPEFVNQTYTTVTPPTEPVTTPAPTPASNQIPGHHVITANGTETLAQIAAKYGTTSADIVAFSKAHKPHISATEAKFFTKPTGKVPKGIVLWVPEKQVTNVTGPGPGGA